MSAPRILSSALLAASLASFSAAASAALVVTIEAPGAVQTTAGFDVVGIENFDQLSSGVYTSYGSDFGGGAHGIMGTYSRVNVIPADVFGGAQGNDQYAVAGLSTTLSYSIVFNQKLTYFGYWLSALDAGNVVEFYANAADTSASYIYTQTNLLAYLDSLSNGSEYFGTPVWPAGGNDREPYAFLNFYLTGGEEFEKIVFRQVGDTSAGYESDNHTVGVWTAQSGDPIPEIVPSAVPEPGTLLLSAFGLGLAGVARRRVKSAEGGSRRAA